MAQDPIDLRRDYFATLRNEIKATKARVFAILMAGLIGSPVLTYFVIDSDSTVFKLVAPLLVLLLLVLYLSEQTMLMRAARYIRDHVESEASDWERWVGGHNMRSAERQLFGMFIVVGLFFYTILIVMAARELGQLGADTPGIEFKNIFNVYFWKYGVLGFYALATIWALGTMVRFWHAATHTSK